MQAQLLWLVPGKAAGRVGRVQGARPPRPTSSRRCKHTKPQSICFTQHQTGLGSSTSLGALLAKSLRPHSRLFSANDLRAQCYTIACSVLKNSKRSALGEDVCPPHRSVSPGPVQQAGTGSMLVFVVPHCTRLVLAKMSQSLMVGCSFPARYISRQCETCNQAMAFQCTAFLYAGTCVLWMDLCSVTTAVLDI